MRYEFRPMVDFSWLRSDEWRDPSPFTASWSDTLDILAREVDALGAGEPVIFEVAITGGRVRQDGMLYAGAVVTSPAVRVSFTTPSLGAMSYRCDRYVKRTWQRSGMEAWQHNVRAIALGLESLRRVDRYGITSAGEQYRGFQELPPGTGVQPSGMTTELALKVVGEEAGATTAGLSAERLRAIVRAARAASHPDRNNGDRARWNAVDEAEQVLTRSGLLP